VDIIKILRETRAGNTGPFDDQCFPAVFAGVIAGYPCVTKLRGPAKWENYNLYVILDTYSEAQFKTLKYRPDFPDRFGSLQATLSQIQADLDDLDEYHAFMTRCRAYQSGRD